MAGSFWAAWGGYRQERPAAVTGQKLACIPLANPSETQTAGPAAGCVTGHPTVRH